jgi:endonuclease YncB( thermonuclease family)
MFTSKMFNCFSILKKNKVKLNLEEKKFNLENISGNFYVESVYDGDTITILVPIKLHIYNMISSDQIDFYSDSNNSNIINFNKIKLRLHGIDTPEIKPLKNILNREEHIIKAKEARDFLSNIILNKIIKVEFLSNDKYGRPLAKIYKDDIYLNNLMIEKGYAKQYDGGTKNVFF